MKPLLLKAKSHSRTAATISVVAWLTFAGLPLSAVAEEAAPDKSQPSAATVEKGKAFETKAQEIPKIRSQEEYWLGIFCGPIPEPVRAQLSIPEDQGLLVHMVTKDSPADKAGIRQYDILLEAAGKVLKSPEDLIAVVNEHKDQTFQITILRKGKTESVNVSGERRPVIKGLESAPPFPGPFASSQDWENWFEWFRKQLPNRPPLTFRFYRPGVVLPPGDAAELPKDLTIVITKQGSEPAKIVVRRGEKTWEVTEKELDKLPKDIRPHVERMLQGGQGKPRGIFELTPFPQPKDLQKEILKSFRPWSAAEAERLDKLEKQMEELKQRVDELSKKKATGST
ncbi:MAG: S1C family serine protease [Thermogutta sp.]